MPKTTEKISVSLPSSILAEVDILATSTRSAFIREALEREIAYKKWFREQVEIGLRQADAGELMPAEDVFTRVLHGLPDDKAE